MSKVGTLLTVHNVQIFILFNLIKSWFKGFSSPQVFTVFSYLINLMNTLHNLYFYHFGQTYSLFPLPKVTKKRLIGEFKDCVK
jgi:hypothetical protein